MRLRSIREQTAAGPIDYTWDEDGSLVAMRYPHGLQVHYVRGPDGRVAEVVTGEGEVLATDVTFEPTGALRGYLRGNGLERAVARNLRGEVTSVSDAGLDWTEMAWSVTGSPEHVVDAGLAETRTYTHDALERLLRVRLDGGGGASRISYQVDVGGNRRLRNVDGKQDTYRYEMDGSALASNRLVEVLDPPPPGWTPPPRAEMSPGWERLLDRLEAVAAADRPGGESLVAALIGHGQRGPLGASWQAELGSFLSAHELDAAELVHVVLAAGGAGASGEGAGVPGGAVRGGGLAPHAPGAVAGGRDHP